MRCDQTLLSFDLTEKFGFVILNILFELLTLLHCDRDSAWCCVAGIVSSLAFIK